MDKELDNKFLSLKRSINKMGSAVIAFSGGLDSSFLLKVSHDILGENALAVTATSQTYPLWEFEEAVKIAEDIGVRHMIIESNELQIEGFKENSIRRCYYCKKELFSKLSEVAKREGMNYVLDGTNVDDKGDYRPGMEAAKELGVRSPLMEAGLGKQEIRDLSKEMGLMTWDKPSFACLSSRFPYGEEITAEELEVVGKAEQFIKSLGFKQVRVRHHKKLARIEVSPEDMNLLMGSNLKSKIVSELKRLGYIYVTVDLKGYRTGSMNEVLPAEKA